MSARIEIRDGVPILLDDTVEQLAPPTPNGSDPQVTPELHEDSRTFIESEMKKTEADDHTVSYSSNKKSPASIVLKKDGKIVSAFFVPTAAADEGELEQFHTYVAEINAPKPSHVPPDVPREEWDRRSLAVRDAAREMDIMGEGDAKDYLRGRAKELSQVDIPQFLADVNAQRIDDLSDILDYQLRMQVEGMMRARRWVRMVAPKGWVLRTFSRLSDADVIRLANNLQARGWEPQTIADKVVSRVSGEERRKKLIEQYLAGVKASKKKGKK